MQEYVTMFGLALLSVPLAATLALLLVSQAFCRLQADPGWRLVRPGLGYWTALWLSLALAILIGWVWLFVGSSRSDGATQMQIAWWLAFLFACGAAFSALRIVRLHRLSLRWRGETVRWRGAGDLPMRKLRTLTTHPFGYASAAFADGARVRIDLAALNAAELVEKLEDVNGLAREERVPEH